MPDFAWHSRSFASSSHARTGEDRYVRYFALRGGTPFLLRPIRGPNSAAILRSTRRPKGGARSPDDSQCCRDQNQEARCAQPGKQITDLRIDGAYVCERNLRDHDLSAR